MISGYDVMNEFKLEAPQFVFDCDFKRKLVYCLYIQHLFSRIDFNDGGRKDLSSASITRAFLVEEMSGDRTGSLLPFVKLPTISLFQILGIAARTPA